MYTAVSCELHADCMEEVLRSRLGILGIIFEIRNMDKTRYRFGPKNLLEIINMN